MSAWGKPEGRHPEVTPESCVQLSGVISTRSGVISTRRPCLLISWEPNSGATKRCTGTCGYKTLYGDLKSKKSNRSSSAGPFTGA